VTTVSSNEALNHALSILFAPGERWGWEDRDVTQFFQPFSPPVPTLIGPPPPNLHALELRRDLLKKEQGEWRGRNLVLAIPGIFILPFLIRGLPALAVVLIWIIGYTWLVWHISQCGHRVEKADGELRNTRTRWEKEWAKLEQEQEQRKEQWTQARDAHNVAEQQRVAALSQWGAVRPASQARRVDVYGGTNDGWQSLVTTLGASLLGSGQSLSILDFSETDVPALFWNTLPSAGIMTGHVIVLPRDQEQFDVLAGLDATGIKDILVEALHADGQDTNRLVRSYDDRILGDICTILAPRITLERIDLALRVLLRHIEPPQNESDPFTFDEWSRLTNLYNDDYRRVYNDRFVALTSQLHQVRFLGRTNEGSHPAATVQRCECISISREGTTLLNELLVDILVQWYIRRLRGAADGPDQPDVVMLIGADGLKRRHLERLDAVASRQSIRIIYLFRHLREEGLQMAGSGDSVIALMRLGNSQEAEHAANFIGKDYKFKESQRSVSTGTTTTVTWSDTRSRTATQAETATQQSVRLTEFLLGGGRSWSQGTSVSDTLGRTEGESTAESEQKGVTKQRVHEYVLEPEMIRSLPSRRLFLVEFSAEAGGRRVTGADCSPELSALPRVSPQPFSSVP